jgi:solute:Na+ symporter, SSS family
MSTIDWLVLFGTLAFIIMYGVWKSKNTKTLSTYLLADRKLPWYHIGLSVMATQASAITFLAGPGQGFEKGIGFVQFYFGLPLAMIFISIVIIPIFHKLNVYTAYEYLENRFDLKTRSVTAFLFLLQRGLSTGITIYAPAIILSTILSIDIRITILINGILVVFYTVYGGTKAVSYTQLLQMAIIFSGLFMAAYMVMDLMPKDVGIGDALHIAGKMDKLNAIDTKLDFNTRYNIWSGIIGGFFLQLSYFGTDQSQVGRYLTGKSVNQSRIGLLMNGLVKIPMQFFILLIGAMVFVFYQFASEPLFFNQTEVNKIKNSQYAESYTHLEEKYETINLEKRKFIELYHRAEKEGNSELASKSALKMKEMQNEAVEVKKELKGLMKKNDGFADTDDSNFVFLIFVTKNLPVGVVGLLIAVIFLAGMGSTASGLSSLASTTIVDFYKRFKKSESTDKSDLFASRVITLLWGAFCVGVAFFAAGFGNLIEAVNILGSLFYGTILGIFLVAFFMKFVKGKAVFLAAIITEVLVVVTAYLNLTEYLWLNLIGSVVLMVLAALIQLIMNENRG